MAAEAGKPGPEARVDAWASELRRVHQQLRDALAIAREAIEDAEAAGATAEGGLLPRDLLLHCWGFCLALNGHHTSEDRALFPQIAQARPELAPVLTQLSQDHSMIAHLVDGLEQALTTGAPSQEQLRHLDGIEAVMETHFRYEERRLISVLDALELTGDRRRLLGPLG